MTGWSGKSKHIGPIDIIIIGFDIYIIFEIPF